MPYTKAKPYCVITAVLVPNSSVVPLKTSDSDTLCKEFTVEELKNVDLSGVPVKLEHEGDFVFGSVKDSKWIDGAGLVVVLEIPMTDDVNTKMGQTMMNIKKIVTLAAEHKILKDVSIAHAMILVDDVKDTWYVNKYVLEVSITYEGAKENSRIYEVKWYSKPYSKSKNTFNLPLTRIRLPSKPLEVKPFLDYAHVQKFSKYCNKITMTDVNLLEKLTALEKELEEKNQKLHAMRQLEEKAKLYDETISNINKEAVTQINKLNQKNNDVVMEVVKQAYDGPELTQEMTKLENATKEQMELMTKITNDIQNPGSEPWNPADFVNLLSAMTKQHVVCCSVVKKMKKSSDGASVPTKVVDPLAGGTSTSSAASTAAGTGAANSAAAAPQNTNTPAAAAAGATNANNNNNTNNNNSNSAKDTAAAAATKKPDSFQFKPLNADKISSFVKTRWALENLSDD